MITTQQTIINNILDIHCHILYDVDDGSRSIDESINELEKLKDIGINRVICTPHACSGDVKRNKKIKENYNTLKVEAKKLGIDLYLGNEIMISSNTIDLLENGRLLSLNNSKYLLVEFKRNESNSFDLIINILESLIDFGYHVILAHPEFYNNYRNIEYIQKLKDIGVILQMDAISILKGKVPNDVYKFAKKMLKEGYFDIVASDNHCHHRNYNIFYKSFKKIYKKYGKEYAEILFATNPNIILEN